MPFVNPADCRNLPFTPMEPAKFGVFALQNSSEEIGFRRCATVQPGRWLYHPTYELTRVMINTSTKTVFSRTGLPLPDTESDLFKPQLTKLCSDFPKAWLDGYIRVLRTGETDASFGQGSFLIQDLVIPEVPLWDRIRLLNQKIPELGICRLLPHRSVYRVPVFPDHVSVNLWAATLEVQEAWENTKRGTVYTGITGKMVASEYAFLSLSERAMSWIVYPFSPKPAYTPQSVPA